MNKLTYNLPFIVSQFKIEGSVATIQPHGSGHIHDTFHVANAQSQYPDYLLQRINHHVFKNVPALTENIRQVTKHLRNKLKTIPGSNAATEVLTLISANDGKGYYQDESGNYWRMYIFLADTRNYDLVQTANQAYEGGIAFGRFLSLLADLDAKAIHDTIPNFHNIESRLALFNEAIRRDPVGRVKEVTTEINFVKERAEKMSTILRMGRKGELPLRITHNDTKFNNVLLDKHDKAQCVIDLDTVMPGYVAYDFGDAIRTSVNTAPEDEKDTTKIGVNLELFKGFTRGFLQETKDFLTQNEIESLAMGVLLLPYIMGLRFLTDYIDGDTYYKIHFPEHNIQRSRAQLTLVARLEEQYEVLQDIIRTTARSKKAEEELK